MFRRNLAALIALTAPMLAGTALAQSASESVGPDLVCNWCDRLPNYIKKYTYDRNPETKKPLDAKVEYVAFEKAPTVRRPLEAGTEAQQQLINVQGENTGFVYCVCAYHYELELAIAFASGTENFGKHKPAEGAASFPAAPVTSRPGETRATYVLDGSPSTTVCVLEIDHPGYTAASMDDATNEMTKGLTSEQKTEFKKANQATYRFWTMDPKEKGSDLRQGKTGSLAKLGEDLAAEDIHFRLERATRPKDDTRITADATRDRRRLEHHFESGEAWVVRTGEDPLRRVLPRDEMYSKVKANKEAGQVVKLLSEQLGEYVDALLSEFKDLETELAKSASGDNLSEEQWAARSKLQLRLGVLSSQIDDARAHLSGLADITFCMVHSNNPAVEMWTDHTEHEIPHVVGLSPMDGGYVEYDEQKNWDYILPYLAVIGVVLVSSVLSLFGIKLAG